MTVDFQPGDVVVCVQDGPVKTEAVKKAGAKVEKGRQYNVSSVDHLRYQGGQEHPDKPVLRFSALETKWEAWPGQEGAWPAEWFRKTLRPKEGFLEQFKQPVKVTRAKERTK